MDWVIESGMRDWFFRKMITKGSDLRLEFDEVFTESDRHRILEDSQALGRLLGMPLPEAWTSAGRLS
jgi:hypothetical protein